MIRCMIHFYNAKCIAEEHFVNHLYSPQTKGTCSSASWFAYKITTAANTAMHGMQPSELTFTQLNNIRDGSFLNHKNK